jgi:hypothetical protein
VLRIILQVEISPFIIRCQWKSTFNLTAVKNELRNVLRRVYVETRSDDTKQDKHTRSSLVCCVVENYGKYEIHLLL